MILAFVLSANSFQSYLLQYKFSNTKRMTNRLDPDQAQYFIGPNLHQNSSVFIHIIYCVGLDQLPHIVAK